LIYSLEDFTANSGHTKFFYLESPYRGHVNLAKSLKTTTSKQLQVSGGFLIVNNRNF
jgi:hypothetical protein